MSARRQAAAIASAGEAEQAIANLNTIMDRLEQTVAEETALVRAGHLRDGRRARGVKGELARRYQRRERAAAAPPAS